MKKYVYLLGTPIAHSKSPVMHNALYAKLKLDWEYLGKELFDEQEALQFIEAKDYLGLNITTPYKPLAFDAATVKASSAKLAKGANVLVNREGALIAYNMDGEGCVSYLEQVGVDFTDAVVVVCGTGPTALAILHSAALAKAQKVVLLGRNKERTEKALSAYLKEFRTLAYATIALPPLRDQHRSFRETYEETQFSFGSYRSAKKIVGEADIIINATPVGMSAEEKLPISYDLLHEGQSVFDVVYGHGESYFIAQARAHGCAAYDGKGMLVAQAVSTAKVLFDIAGIEYDLSDEEMFRIMADAAGFEC